MKDKQIAPASIEPRIFLVSALLHCVSMTALVYLRSSFGFGYLRPKSVFFALSWAFGLYAAYAWIEGAGWQQQRALLLFGAGALVLYWIHLFTAFIREWNQVGEHDHYSGTSHPVRLRRRSGRASTMRFESRLHLWGEPGTVLLIAAVAWAVFKARELSLWLSIVAACLWSKEALNHWYGVRQWKRQQDVFDDTTDTVEPLLKSHLASKPPNPTRKAKIKRERNADAAVTDASERRYAEILRLLPPYDLADAERHYHTLIKEAHPDANDSSAESTVRSGEMNEAMEFFRNKRPV